MPTLVRLLMALAVIAGVTFAAMAALVHFVEPRQGTIVVDVPLDSLRSDEAPRRLDTGVPD